MVIRKLHSLFETMVIISGHEAMKGETLFVNHAGLNSSVVVKISRVRTYYSKYVISNKN